MATHHGAVGLFDTATYLAAGAPQRAAYSSTPEDPANPPAAIQNVVNRIRENHLDTGAGETIATLYQLTLNNSVYAVMRTSTGRSIAAYGAGQAETPLQFPTSFPAGS
jgi:hypothetical protein